MTDAGAHKGSFITIFLMAALIAAAIIGPRCKDSDEYEPPPDTLVAPPAAPVIAGPADNFVFMPPDFPFDIVLDWDTVFQAEIYELEITRGSDAPYTIMLDYDSSIYRIYLDTIYYHPYKWRVRAHSSKWIGGVTDWSLERGYEVRWRPPPPALLLPPDGSVFYLDSGFAYSSCCWDTVSDEQYYEIMFMKDTIVVEQSITSYPQYDFVAYDTGTYFWTVRAGSSLWQQFTSWAMSWTFTVADTMIKR